MTKSQLKQYLNNNPDINSKELLDYLHTPEIIQAKTHIAYKLNNKLHHKDGPAKEYSNGRKGWYLKGKLHRINGPAVTPTRGLEVWYLNGKFIRKSQNN